MPKAPNLVLNRLASQPEAEVFVENKEDSRPLCSTSNQDLFPILPLNLVITVYF